MLRFNPAPGWPPAPPGWLPPPGWQPDPSWPPAPAGWEIVVEDRTGRRVSRSTRNLLIASGIATLSILFLKAGLPVLVLAGIAALLGRSRPRASATLTKVGWFALPILAAVIVLATILDYASNP